MTELFNGGELDAFTPSDSSVIESTNNSGPRFDSNFARCGISCGADAFGGTDATYAETIHWSEQTEGYLHFDLFMSQASVVDGTLLSLYNDASTARFRIRTDRIDGTTHTLILQYLNASAVWTNAGTVDVPVSLQTFDLHWKCDASGELDLYIGGSSRIAWTGDLSHLDGIAFARLHRLYSYTVWSQVMADTDPTVGYRLATYYPSGAGSTSAWTGTYANIDEAVTNDGDFLNSGTANQVTTVAITGPALTGYTVQSVTVSARANRDASGPQNLQLALRSSGTDYFSGSSALTIGYAAYQNIWTTDPATSAAWVNTAIATLQPGVKSIT